MSAVCWLPFSCNLMAQVSSNKQLAYSTHTSGVLPRQLPIIILVRETGPWREKSHGDMCFCCCWKTVNCKPASKHSCAKLSVLFRYYLKRFIFEISLLKFVLNSVLNIVWRHAYIWKYMLEVYTQLMKIQEQIYRLLGNRKCWGRSGVQHKRGEAIANSRTFL